MELRAFLKKERTEVIRNKSNLRRFEIETDAGYAGEIYIPVDEARDATWLQILVVLRNERPL